MGEVALAFCGRESVERPCEECAQLSAERISGVPRVESSSASKGARQGSSALESFELSLGHVESEVIEAPRDRGGIPLIILFEIEEDFLGAGVSEDAFEHCVDPGD